MSERSEALLTDVPTLIPVAVLVIFAGSTVDRAVMSIRGKLLTSAGLRKIKPLSKVVDGGCCTPAPLFVRVAECECTGRPKREARGAREARRACERPERLERPKRPEAGLV